MWKFVTKRLLSIILVLLGATFITFSIMAAAPNDITVLLSPDATEAQREQMREDLGLNRPFLVRYGDFLLDLCRGDLGTSLKSGAPVMDELIQRVPYTIKLAVAASVIMLLVAIPLGVVAALKQNSIFDSVSMAFCLAGVAMPPFWIGLLLMLLFSVKLDWLPTSGADSWMSLILPAATQCVAGMASIGRMTRSSMLEVIRQDYIRTARAKGLPESTVITHHAMKNAMLPTITAAGLQRSSVRRRCYRNDFRVARSRPLPGKLHHLARYACRSGMHCVLRDFDCVGQSVCRPSLWFFGSQNQSHVQEVVSEEV